MEVIEVQEDQKENWNNFVKENGTLLQSWEWGDFKSQYLWKIFRLVVSEDNEWVLVASVLCRQLPLSKSFLYIPEGPVINSDAKSKVEQYLGVLLEKIKAIAEEERSIFLKIEPFWRIPDEQFKKLNFRKSFENIQPKYRLWIDLTLPEEKILEQMKHKGRYNIKLAERKGVSIIESSDGKMLDDFYSLYKQTASRDKFTRRPKDYFHKLLDMLTETGYGKLFIALWNKQPLSAILITNFGKYATYLYGATSSAHRELMASYFIQWEAMKRAKKEGFQIYDFGAIAPTEEKHHWSGLREFKIKFGGEQVELPGCYDLVYRPFLYNLFKTIEKFRRREE